MADYEVRIEGLDRLLRKTSRSAEVIGPPVRQMFDRIGRVVESEAKNRAPVDEGRLRAGITYQIDSGAVPQWVKVGVLGSGGRLNLYARVMEFGRKPGKFPPIAALEGWARRHGIPRDRVFLIARAIARKGIKGRFYLRDGMAASRGRIDGYVAQAARDIEAAWRR